MIAIIGGSGLIGSAVAQRLAADGFPVRLVGRHAGRLPSGDKVESVRADVRDPASLAAALEGCQGVHVSIKGGPRPEDYDAVEAKGTANVVKACRDLGIGRLTYLSGATVSEKHAGFYGTRAKLEAEKAVRAGDPDWTIFRASWFMESLPLFVRGKRASMIGDPRPPVRLLAAGDFARMVSAAHQGAAKGKLLDARGPRAMTLLEALRAYAAAVDPSLKVGAAPPGLLACIAFLSRDARLADTVHFLKYCADAPETAEGEDAAKALGVTLTDLESWCAERKAGQGNTDATSPAAAGVTYSEAPGSNRHR